MTTEFENKQQVEPELQNEVEAQETVDVAVEESTDAKVDEANEVEVVSQEPEVEVIKSDLELLDEKIAASTKRSNAKLLLELCEFLATKVEDDSIQLPELLENNFFDKFATILHQNLETYTELCTTKNANLVSLLANRKLSLDEYTNRLNRSKRDNENAITFAYEKLIKVAISPFFETMNTARQHFPKDQDNPIFEDFKQELLQYSDNLKSSLEAHGIKQFGEVGEKFDPNRHDAVAQYPAMTPEQSETIAYVNSRGYELNGRVVIPASVIAFI